MTGSARATALRLLLLAALLVGAAVLAFTVEGPGLAEVRSWLAGATPAHWLVAVLGVALALLTPVPRTAVSLLLGAAAGFWPGLAVALAGGLLGGLAGFALARGLGRGAFARAGGPRRAAVDRVLRDHGFLAVVTARVTPVAPFVLVSYAAGLSGVRLAPYVAGTAVGLLPGSVLHVGLGASVALLGSWTAASDTVLAVGVPLAVLVAGVGAGLWRRRRDRRRKGAGRWGAGAPEPAEAPAGG
ncbi:MAG TPA: VTT domain-containing protein [Geodermatophilus sp.]|nr:VTT domain-containing protein [Geodermatophilus sp.]